jgi:hypothetical protein
MHRGLWLETGIPVNNRRDGWRSLPIYLACYLLWFAFFALTVWTILQFRNALLGLLPLVGPWVMGAVDKFGIVLLGMMALGWSFYIEHYLRSGIEANAFWLRVRRIALIQIVVLGIAYGLQALSLIVLFV